MQKLGKQCNFNGMSSGRQLLTNVSFINNYSAVNFEQHVQTTETSTPKTKEMNGTQFKMFLGNV
jgi:hypothetical protein